MADEEEFQVETILKHELYDRATQNKEINFSAPPDIHRQRYHSTYVYFVKWENYGDENNTWEPEEMFAEGNHVLEDYKRRMGLPLKHSKIYHDALRNLIHEKPIKASRSSSSAASLCSHPPKKTANSLVEDYKRRMQSPLRRNEDHSDSIAQAKPPKASSSRLDRTAGCSPAKKAKVSRDFNDAAARINGSPPRADFLAELNKKPSFKNPQKRVLVRSKSPPRAPKKATDVASVEARREPKKAVRIIRYHEDSSNLNCGGIQRELIIRRRCCSAERLNEFWRAKAMEHKKREVLNALCARIYQEQVLPFRDRKIEEKKNTDNLIVSMKEKLPGVFKVERRFKNLMVSEELPTKVKAPLHHSEVLFAPGVFKEPVKKAKPPVPTQQTFRGTLEGISSCDKYHVQKFMDVSSKDTEIPVLGHILASYLNKATDKLHRLLVCRENRSKIALNLLELVPLRDHVATNEDVLKSNITMLINSDDDDSQFCSGNEKVASQRHWRCNMIKVLLTFIQPSDYAKSLLQHHLVHKAVADGRICQSFAFLSAGCSWNDGGTFEVQNGLDIDVNLWVLMRRKTCKAISTYFSCGFDPFTVTWSNRLSYTNDPKAMDISAALDFMSIESSSITQMMVVMCAAMNQFCRKMIEDKLGPRIQFERFQFASFTTPHIIRVARFCGQMARKRSVLAEKNVEGGSVLGMSDVKPALLKSTHLRMVLVVLPFEAREVDRSEDENQPAPNDDGLVCSTIAPAAKISEPSIHIRSNKVTIPLTRLPGVSSSAEFYVVERANINDLMSGGIEFQFNASNDGAKGQSFAVQLFAVEGMPNELNNNHDD